jgi:hypothetical protein
MDALLGLAVAAGGFAFMFSPALFWVGPCLAAIALTAMRTRSGLGVGAAMLGLSPIAFCMASMARSEPLLASSWRCGTGAMGLLILSPFVAAVAVGLSLALAMLAPAHAIRRRLLASACVLHFFSAMALLLAVRRDKVTLEAYTNRLERRELRYGVPETLGATTFSLTLEEPDMPQVGGGRHIVFPLPTPEQLVARRRCMLRWSPSSEPAAHASGDASEELTVHAEVAGVPADQWPASCPSVRVRYDDKHALFIVEALDGQHFAVIEGRRQDLMRSHVRDLFGVPSSSYFSALANVGLAMVLTLYAYRRRRFDRGFTETPHLGGGWFALEDHKVHDARFVGQGACVAFARWQPSRAGLAPYRDAAPSSGSTCLRSTEEMAHASDHTDGALLLAVGALALGIAALLPGIF